MMQKKDSKFWTSANRTCVVCRTEISEKKEGDFSRPRLQDLTEADGPKMHAAIANGDSIWKVRVVYRDGMDDEASFNLLHTTKSEAESASNAYYEGMEFDLLSYLGLGIRQSVFDADNLSVLTSVSIMGRGEAPYIILFEALQGAGVLDRDNRLSGQVLAWIGKEGRLKLIEKFDENWDAVAALEYCVSHFPDTSLASLAARVQVADFVANGNYDAGYASREFEMFYSGAEQLAMKAENVRKLAGIEGGNASKQKRLANLEVLMLEIERLSGVVGLISEKRIVSQAFEAAQDRDPQMAKSKKTLENYETTLRSDPPFKARYDAVFGRNA
jgi:hypothetical protein